MFSHSARYSPFAILNSRAFTLIELLVVVAIIALLVAILLPSLSRAREQTRRTVCASNVKQQALAFHMYQNDFTYLPYSWIRGHTLIGTSGGPFTLPVAVARAMVKYSVHPEDANYTKPKTMNLWKCPSNSSYVPRGFVNPVPPGDSQYFYMDMYAAYTYLNLDDFERGRQPWYPAGMLLPNAYSATHFNQSADHAMVGDATFFHQPNVGANHVAGGIGSVWIANGRVIEGYNTGYGDGHVEWRSAAGIEFELPIEANYQTSWTGFFW